MTRSGARLGVFLDPSVFGHWCSTNGCGQSCVDCETPQVDSLAISPNGGCPILTRG